MSDGGSLGAGGLREPNQKNAPLPDYVVVACEDLARDAVEGWLGGLNSHEVKQASLSGSSDLAGYHATVEFDGFLRSPEPVVSEDGIVLPDLIRDDNRVTVRVLPDREVWEND